MSRRKLFGFLAALLVLPCGQEAAAKKKRFVRKYCYRTDSWKACSMSEINAGDVFELEQVGVLQACDKARRLPNGSLGVDCVYRIDPSSNQWVPVSTGA